MNEDETADQIVSVFGKAVQLVRDRHLGRPVEMEATAMDLLMDFVLLLGAEGLADVLSILAIENNGTPATRSQVKLAVNCRLEAGRLLDAAN
jgi:hypothetical protein